MRKFRRFAVVDPLMWAVNVAVAPVNVAVAPFTSIGRLLVVAVVVFVAFATTMEKPRPAVLVPVAAGNNAVWASEPNQCDGSIRVPAGTRCLVLGEFDSYNLIEIDGQQWMVSRLSVRYTY